MDASDSTPALRDDAREIADDRANELYWGSDMSVNQIAEQLDLSKGALYEMIRPLPAAVSCPDCGAEAVHPNRTALERGLIACLSCGWDGDQGEAAPLAWARDGGPLAKRRSVAPARPSERMRPGLVVPVVIGAAVGVAVFLWAVRRK
jgi:hypothetical protein